MSEAQIISELNLDDVVDESAMFQPDALRALRDLARTKPWEGSFPKRARDFSNTLDRIAKAYGLPPIKFSHSGNRWGCSGASSMDDETGRKIMMSGRLSVVTMLHLFAKCRQIQQAGRLDHFRAIRWSVNIFKRKFPISFSRCRLVSGLLVNPGAIEREAMERANADPSNN